MRYIEIGLLKSQRFKNKTKWNINGYQEIISLIRSQILNGHLIGLHRPSSVWCRGDVTAASTVAGQSDSGVASEVTVSIAVSIAGVGGRRRQPLWPWIVSIFSERKEANVPRALLV